MTAPAQSIIPNVPLAGEPAALLAFTLRPYGLPSTFQLVADESEGTFLGPTLTMSLTSVPEPSSFALLAISLAALTTRRSRKRSAKPDY